MSERILIIVPTYNERNNLGPLAAEIMALGPYHILVVDDNSPDGTGKFADELAAAHPDSFFVLHRPNKAGLGRAYIAGFKWAIEQQYDLIFEMDADFSHDPRHLAQFVNRIREGADVVLGSRYVKGGGTRNWSSLRKVISRGGSLYAQLIIGMPIRDQTSGFKCFRRRALESIDFESISSNGYGFQIEVTYRLYKKGFRIVETPIIFVDRRVGQSKMSSNIVREAALMVWRLRLGK